MSSRCVKQMIVVNKQQMLGAPIVMNIHSYGIDFMFFELVF
jgi:hypothetical protein